MKNNLVRLRSPETLPSCMQAIRVSKRFNPGHISHIEANSRLLEEHGFDVRFSVHDGFLAFPGCGFKSRLANASD